MRSAHQKHQHQQQRPLHPLQHPDHSYKSPTSKTKWLSHTATSLPEPRFLPSLTSFTSPTPRLKSSSCWSSCPRSPRPPTKVRRKIANMVSLETGSWKHDRRGKASTGKHFPPKAYPAISNPTNHQGGPKATYRAAHQQLSAVHLRDRGHDHPLCRSLLEES